MANEANENEARELTPEELANVEETVTIAEPPAADVHAKKRHRWIVGGAITGGVVALLMSFGAGYAVANVTNHGDRGTFSQEFPDFDGDHQMPGGQQMQGQMKGGHHQMSDGQQMQGQMQGGQQMPGMNGQQGQSGQQMPTAPATPQAGTTTP